MLGIAPFHAGVCSASLQYTVDPSSNAERLGLDVCTLTMLCAGAKLQVSTHVVEDVVLVDGWPPHSFTFLLPVYQGRHRAAIKYYARVRASLAECRLPSQHLVSALLILTILARAMCPPTGEGLQVNALAALALRQADLLPEVSPCVRMRAVMMHYALAGALQARNGDVPSVWVPVHAPAGRAA